MKKYLLRRYLLFLVSIFINTVGIAAITRALLGTSPITSVNYVLSLFTPLTMGQWTILVNLLFTVIELPLMGRDFLRADLRAYLSQIPITLCFGMFIDCSMAMLSWVQPATYAVQLATLAAGCGVLALGIALEVKANVAMLAGEYLVKVLARRLRFDFGYVKLCFDVSLVLLACLMSWLALSRIDGVREGTVVAAVVVGPVIHAVSPWLRVLDRWLGRQPAPAAAAPSGVAPVVTIAREYGSGGLQLARRLAADLGLPLYDRQFITLAAQESGLTEAYIRANEQSIPSLWLKSILAHGVRPEDGLSPDDALYIAESRVVERLAAQGPCVIVGRLADFVLRGRPNTVRVFCCADFASECRRCAEEYGVAAEAAPAEVRRVNRARIAHYEYYTGEKWGDPHRYDLTINTGIVGMEEAAALVRGLYAAARARAAG